MSTDSVVIEIKDLHRRFGRHDAVNGLNLRVRPGRCFGFLARVPNHIVPSSSWQTECADLLRIFSIGQTV
jgi:ABC-type histidine transport system ATPase subunit